MKPSSEDNTNIYIVWHERHLARQEKLSESIRKHYGAVVHNDQEWKYY